MPVRQPEGSARVLSKAETETDHVQLEPVDPEQEVSLLALLIVIARKKNRIAWTALGMIAAALAITLLMSNRYTAVTTVLPPQKSDTSTSSIMAQMGNLGAISSLASGGLGLKNPNDLQVALLKSQTVEDAMVQRFHLQDLYHAKLKSTARKRLESAVSIDSGAKDSLIRISVTDISPQRAAAMANGYVEEYKKFSATLALNEASQRRVFFEQQLSHTKDDLANAEESLKLTEQQTGLIQLNSQTQAVIQSVAQLHAQIVSKEVEIRAMRSFATNDNPELQVAEEELAGLQAQEQKMGAGESLNALAIPKGQLQASSLVYVRKLRDVKYYQTIFDLLARQYEVAKIDEAREGALIQVVDVATVPDRHSSPKRTLIVLGAAVLGVFFGVVWTLIAEGYARLSNNPAEKYRLEELKTLLSKKRREARV